MVTQFTLSDFVRRYVESRSVSEDYANRIKSRAGRLQAFCGAISIAEVLTESNVNRFLATLAHLAPQTQRCYRRDLLVLWRAAGDDGLAAYPVARKIRRPRLGQLIVEAYTLDEARALIKAVGQLRGCYPNGVAKRLYWSAVIRAGWDSGLRRGDLWTLRRDAIRPDGSAMVCQSKTRQVVTVRLRASTVAALDAIGLSVPLAWPLTASRFGRHFKRLTRAAGVNRGTFKFLRRSSGSYVEAELPGAGCKHLGNGAAVFAKHYDARLGAASLPLPPEL